MRGRHGRRAAVLALAMVAALGAGASCARAASVSLTQGFPATVWFSGEGVDADTVTVRVDPGAVTVSDSTATLTAASGCDQVDAHSATCTVPDGMLAGVY